MADTKETIKKIARAFDNGLLKYSSTRLGQTDYDKDKVYDQEERKATWKDVGIILGVVVISIAIASFLVLVFLT